MAHKKGPGMKPDITQEEYIEIWMLGLAILRALCEPHTDETALQVLMKQENAVMGLLLATKTFLNHMATQGINIKPMLSGATENLIRETIKERNA